jgi:hypothetical protein
LDERWFTKATQWSGQQKETGLQDFQDFRIDQSSVHRAGLVAAISGVKKS